MLLGSSFDGLQICHEARAIIKISYLKQEFYATNTVMSLKILCIKFIVSVIISKSEYFMLTPCSYFTIPQKE